jgi:hypothetical protein
MTRFKAGAIVAQLVKHNARREVPDPTVAGWAPHVADFIRQVHALLASG